MDPGSGAGVTVVVCIAGLSIFIPEFFVIPGLTRDPCLQVRFACPVYLTLGLDL